MKKVTLLVLALGLTFGVFAQRTISRNDVQTNPFMKAAAQQFGFKASKAAVKAADLTVSVSGIEEKDDSFHAVLSVDMGSALKFFATVYSDQALENYIASENSQYSTMEEYFAAMIDNYLANGYTEEQIYAFESGDLEFSGMSGNSAYEAYVYAVYEDGETAVVTYSFSTPSSVISGTPVINKITPNADVDELSMDFQFDMENVRTLYLNCESFSDIEEAYADYMDQGYTMYDFAVNDLQYFLQSQYSSYFIFSDEDDVNSFYSQGTPFGEWVEGEEYILVAVPVNGNNDQGEIYSIEFVFGGNVGLNDVADLMFAVYPNPASDYIVVKSDKINRVELYNELGQVVLNSNVNGNQNISLAGVAAGTYVVKAYANGAVATSKVVVK